LVHNIRGRLRSVFTTLGKLIVQIELSLRHSRKSKNSCGRKKTPTAILVRQTQTEMRDDKHLLWSPIATRNPAFAGYEKGVPMGGDLRARSGDAAPSFMVFALRDPIGGNLDRIQIVKGWLNDDGDTQENVYDIVWSGDRIAGTNGKLPPVSNTVDAATASFTNAIGASELAAVWEDPDFDPEQPAFYYARVIEIPTPRWSTHEAFRFGVPIPEGAPVSTQERAYTSPVWYTP
jgi:hypothetical protein